MERYMGIFLIYLFIINLIGFLAFYIDKRRARNNKWRIPESRLFLLAVLGGGLGCTLGMKVFRHKTKHLSFVLGIPTILLVEFAMIAIMHHWLIK